MPQKTRVGNDRSQSTTDVARRRNRNKKLYKAGARSSVTLAAQNTDRRAAVSEIELALSTHSSRSSCREADTRRWPTRHSGHRLEPHIMRAGLSGCLQQPFGRLPLLGSRDRDQRAVGGAREHDLCPQTCAALLAAQSAGHDSRRCVEDRRSSQIERYSMINSNEARNR